MHARVRDALQQTRESQASISVPAELVDPHPLVRAAAARLKRRDGWDHPAGVRSAPKEVLDLQVTRNTLDRALLLMDTLLRSSRHAGPGFHVMSGQHFTPCRADQSRDNHGATVRSFCQLD